MTLKEWLEGKDGTTAVKIGFREGTTYFYCGYLFDGIEFLLESLGKEYYEQNRKELRKATDMLANKNHLLSEKIAKEIMTKVRIYMRKQTDALDDIKEDSYSEFIKDDFYEFCENIRVREYDKAVKRKAYLEEVLKMPMSLLSREVVTVNNSIDELGALNIEIEGAGNGKYWSSSECKNDSKMQKKIEEAKKRYDRTRKVKASY